MELGNANTVTDNQPVDQASPIMKAIYGQTEMIKSLEKCLDNLEDRVYTVLTPATPDVNPEEPSAETNASPTRYEIDKNTDRLYKIKTRVIAITERLES